MDSCSYSYKKRYGSIAVKGLDLYESLAGNMQARLDKADFQDESSEKKDFHMENCLSFVQS